MVVEENGRCLKCILPKSAHFKFNEDGICELCSNYKSSEEKNEIEPIISIIRKKGIGHKYDCVVGISGGRDSSYLLYLLVKKHNLRCFAAYYRTPFTSEETEKNVRRLIEYLNIPIEEINLSQELHKNIAKDMTTLWIKNHDPVVANLACAPCKYVNRELFKIAKKHKVKSIICGGNKYEGVQIATSINRKQSNIGLSSLSFLSQIRTNLSLIKKGINLLFNIKEIWKYLDIGFKSSLLYVNPHTPFLHIRYFKIKAYDYFFLTEYNEKEADSILKEIDWHLPYGCNSKWRSDCSFAEIKNFMFMKMMNISYVDAYYSNMVRGGAISREEALQRVTIESQISKYRINNALTIMDLPKSIEKYFNNI